MGRQGRRPLPRYHLQSWVRMTKQKISASAVAADVRSGISDAELMQKYSVSAKGLGYLFQKLVENNFLTAEEMSLRSQTHSKPVEPDRQIYPAPAIRPGIKAKVTGTENTSYSNDCAWEDYWENRGSLGLLGAYVHTVSRCLTAPTHFFTKLPLDLGYWSPTLFGGVSAGVPAAFTVVCLELLMGRASILDLGYLTILAGITVIITIALAFIGLFIWSALVHGSLMVLRGAYSDFQSTFRVVSYSCAPQLCAAIPVIGVFAGNVWGLYLSGVGLRETHKTSTGKAFGAVAMPLAVVVVASAMLGLHYNSFTIWKQPLSAKKATVSAAYTGERLPSEVCSAVSDFITKVDTAATQLFPRQAQLAIQGALEELDGKLKGFSDRPNIDDVREKAVAFAATRLRVKVLEHKTASISEIRQEENKTKQLQAEFEAMCSR